MRTPATQGLLVEALSELRAELASARAPALEPSRAPESSVEEAIRAARRVAIAGGPRTGKTTLARAQKGRLILETDHLIRWFDWSELSEHVVRRCSQLDEFIVEGVRAAHALRKGLVVDLVVWLDTPRAELSEGQKTLEKATRTVFEEWARASRTPIHRVTA